MEQRSDIQCLGAFNSSSSYIPVIVLQCYHSPQTISVFAFKCTVFVVLHSQNSIVSPKMKDSRVHKSSWGSYRRILTLNNLRTRLAPTLNQRLLRRLRQGVCGGGIALVGIMQEANIMTKKFRMGFGDAQERRHWGLLMTSIIDLGVPIVAARSVKKFSQV